MGGGVIAGPVVTLLAWLLGQPLDSAREYGRSALDLGQEILFSIEGLFALSPRIASAGPTHSKFKSVIAEIGEASGVSMGAPKMH